MPLCRAGRTARGLALAVAFGVGLAIALTVWGVVVAGLGGLFGLREVARYLSLAGGVVTYVLGLWMLALIRFRLPSARLTLPGSIGKRSAPLTAFALGLLLGNMGLCCPDPVFLSLIPFIATSELPDGALLAAAYGLGRATPLVVLVILVSSGIDALRLATEHKPRVDRALGWALVAIGNVILHGYSNLSEGTLVAVLLMLGPVLAHHMKSRSPWPRAVMWLAATAAATVVGLRVVYLVLLNLP